MRSSKGTLDRRMKGWASRLCLTFKISGTRVHLLKISSESVDEMAARVG